MIDPRFPQDRPIVASLGTLVLIAFGIYVLSVVGAYRLGRQHEQQEQRERYEAFQSQAKHWQREAGR